MKALLPGILFFLMVVFFDSCQNSDRFDYGLGAYKEEIASVKKNGIYTDFLLDDGRYVHNVKIVRDTTLKDDQRLLINYTILSDSTPGFYQTVRLNFYDQVLSSSLYSWDKARIDSFPDDPVELSSAWLGRHYLNISIYIDYNSKQHKILLAADKNNVGDSTVYLYFKQDDNGDTKGASTWVVASYDLEPVLGNPLGDRKIIVRFNTTNYGAAKLCEFFY